MNGIHDMGGMSGFGPIPIEQDERVTRDAMIGVMKLEAVGA